MFGMARKTWKNGKAVDKGNRSESWKNYGLMTKDTFKKKMIFKKLIQLTISNSNPG